MFLLVTKREKGLEWGKWPCGVVKGKSHSALCVGLEPAQCCTLEAFFSFTAAVYLFTFLSVHLSRSCKFCSIKDHLWPRCLRYSHHSLPLLHHSDVPVILSGKIISHLQSNRLYLSHHLSVSPSLFSLKWLAGPFLCRVCRNSLENKCGGLRNWVRKLASCVNSWFIDRNFLSEVTFITYLLYQSIILKMKITIL